jgi:arginyl-tRNA synthetase
MTVFHQVRKDLSDTIQRTFNLKLENIGLNFTSDHGELSTNVSFAIAKILRKTPFEVALLLKTQLEELKYIKVAEAAMPGFINLTLWSEFWHEHFLHIVKNNAEYMIPKVGKGKRVNVEYVSVNPTGPMHIGHARLAAYGDVLANLLKKCGFEITKEFYINDYGSQIKDLVSTVWIRYKNIVLNQDEQIPTGLYPGEYLIEVAKEISNLYGDSLLQNQDWFLIVRKHTLDSMMRLIRQDLECIKVRHDVFTSETLMHQSGKVAKVVELLKAKNLVYEGVIPEPKGHQGPARECLPQLLFKSTQFGDIQDRSVAKEDGSWSYFGAELAYIKDKIDRGFESLIIVLGADHIGYVDRLKAAVEALSEGNTHCDIRVCQLVKYFESGVPIAMSKRKGTFASVKSLIEEIGCDVFRFMMISKTNDIPLDIDITTVQAQSKDNPVFYVNYAYARSRSVLRKIDEHFPGCLNNLDFKIGDASKLTRKEELAIIRKFAQWPKVVEEAALSREPHRIVAYLGDLAVQFHYLWDLRDLQDPYRFIVKNDLPLTVARSLIARATINIIDSGFGIIGIEPMTFM